MDLKKPSIELTNITHRYPLFNYHEQSLKKNFLEIFTKKSNLAFYEAFSNLNINLTEGDRLGILGPNGSGKTTLLKIISGVIYPTSGVIRVNGRLQSMLGLSSGFNPELTGLENIKQKLIIQQVDAKQHNSLTSKIVAFADLKSFINQPIKIYSSGMLMRLSFASSLMINPDILIMDEWISTGDSQFKIKMQEALNEKINQSKILVIASHQEQLIKKLCNKTINLVGGSGAQTIYQ